MILSHGLLWNFFLKSVTLIIHFNFNTSGSWRVTIPLLKTLIHCQFQFSLPQTTLEMATVEKLLHIPEDSVPCKIRAKRGCATHPRSIAERVSKH